MQEILLSQPLGIYDMGSYQIEEHQIGAVLIYVPIHSLASRSQTIQKASSILPTILLMQEQAIAYAIATAPEISTTPAEALCIFAIRFSSELSDVEYEINFDPDLYDDDLIEPIFVKHNLNGEFSLSS